MINNFEIIFDWDIVVFIQTDANKKTAAKILSKYHVLNQLKVLLQNLGDCFKYKGYRFKMISIGSKNFDNMIMNKKYQVIDLSQDKYNKVNPFYSI